MSQLIIQINQSINYPNKINKLINTDKSLGANELINANNNTSANILINTDKQITLMI